MSDRHESDGAAVTQSRKCRDNHKACWDTEGKGRRLRALSRAQGKQRMLCPPPVKVLAKEIRCCLTLPSHNNCRTFCLGVTFTPTSES